MGQQPYWIYENWRARGHRAVLHVETCSFCRAGRGLSTGTDSRNGRWRGPFPTLSAAQVAAGQTGAATISPHVCI